MKGVAVALPLALPSLAAAQGPTSATVSACFSPGLRSCADAIDGVGASIRVQACWLTSVPILRALAAARRRDLAVQAILDKAQDRTSDPRGRYSPAVFLVHAGIPAWIDDGLAIAYNKVLILGGARVVTGSFSFTKSADMHNAENPVVLDSPDVAAWFTANWNQWRAASRAFAAE